jgi:predicted HAD superfamily phosphohydrolase
MERRIMVTVTKSDLIALGYGTSFAANIIREAKKLMISKGHTYYQSRKLDRVPKEAVEEILGITIPDRQN